MIWHSHPTADVLKELQVDPAVGLHEQDVVERQKEYGKNSLREQRPLPFRQALGQQFRAPLIILLLAVAGVVLVADLFKQVLKDIPTDWEQALLVAVLAIVSALFGAVLRYYTASAVSSLHRLSDRDVRVRRDGADSLCPTHALVPGDVIFLQAGDVVPADCRLIETEGLRCDESGLTDGNALADKDADAIFDDITPLTERTNMLYADTIVTAGTAVAVVVATGARSEMSRRQRTSARHSGTSKKSHPLMLWWNGMAVALSILALIVGLVQHADRSAVILTAAVLAMALVPQNAEEVLTQQSVRAAKKMSRHQVRLYRHEAAETLGRVTVFCVEQDTLIGEDDVHLNRVYVGRQSVNLNAPAPAAPGLTQLLRLAALNAADNSPIDSAILNGAKRLGIERTDLLVDMPRIGELTTPDAHRIGVHLAGEQTLILVTGEWRTLLPLCTKGNFEELTDAATAMEADGLQVQAVTYRLTDTAPAIYTAEEFEHDLTCTGLLGLQMPLCRNVSDAVNAIPSLRTILFSDQPASAAAATALQAGLTDTPCVATADTIENLTDSEWVTTVSAYNVYCGLTPKQKQRVVSALQAQGEVVAVTGYRPDDVDLLTEADLGFARGNDAADVAKSAADVLLIDDSYPCAIATLWEGRRLKEQRLCAIFHLALCALVMTGIGLSGLFGWTVLRHQAILLMGLHLLLMDMLLPALVFIGQTVIDKK